MKTHFPIYDILATKKTDGREAVRRIIERRTGKLLDISTMRMWRALGRVPYAHTLVLMQECRETKRSCSPSDFFLKEEFRKEAAE